MTGNTPPEDYPRLSPYLYYEDLEAALIWLNNAFGMVERMRMVGPSGDVAHAEMTFYESVIMMGAPGAGYRNPGKLGQTTQSLYIYVEDADALCERARGAGAKIIEEPADQHYGDRRCGISDPEGHVWYFATRL